MIAMKQPNGKFTMELTGDEIGVLMFALTESLVQGNPILAELLERAITTAPKETVQGMLNYLYEKGPNCPYAKTMGNMLILIKEVVETR